MLALASFASSQDDGPRGPQSLLDQASRAVQAAAQALDQGEHRRGEAPMRPRGEVGVLCTMSERALGCVVVVFRKF